jgi:hypothetical protein
MNVSTAIATAIIEGFSEYEAILNYVPDGAYIEEDFELFSLAVVKWDGQIFYSIASDAGIHLLNASFEATYNFLLINTYIV